MKKHTVRIRRNFSFRSHGAVKVIVPAIILLLLFTSLSYAYAKDLRPKTSFKAHDRDGFWDVALNVYETSGKTDSVVFGEAFDAWDGPPADFYDQEKSPLPPYLRAWLNDNLPPPENLLQADYRHYPGVSKIWNLTVHWIGAASTVVTISWDSASINISEYTTVLLCTNEGAPVANMKLDHFYTFTCPVNVPQLFKIICFVSPPNNPLIDITLFLEGPYNGNTMNTNLNNAGYLPLTQPYSGSPWSYSGTEQVTSIPNINIVDWVLVELRDAPTAASATTATRIARQAGFLLKNGTIVGMDGSSRLQFMVTPQQNLFVVVWHRNHLAVLSAYPLVKYNEVCSYDFYSAAKQAYGIGHKQIGPALWGMYGGDGNANGQVNNADKVDVWAPQVGTSGYKTGDFNLNGQVNNQDKNDIWIPNVGRGSQVPI